MSIALSVVSHGHGPQVMRLLDGLAVLAYKEVREVVLTLNIPETALLRDIRSREWPFELKIIQNERARGFGSNHNAAFHECSLSRFCVMNPDVTILENPFPSLLAGLAMPGAGCAFPVQTDEVGGVQLSARVVPTPSALLRRYFPGLGLMPARRNDAVHWVSGACMLFDSTAYRALGGFDERFFMYCEDVDICLRLQLLGYGIVATNAKVVHVASQASHRDARHLRWHIQSLLRLWRSDSYKAFLKHPGGAS